MSRIRLLPQDVAAHVQSSKQITSIQDVLLGLLENSLDSGASRLEASIDFRRGDCSIEDNGVGIPPFEFGRDGGLCKLHHSSKHSISEHTDLHGFSGTYLASLATLSLLAITSRHKDHARCVTLKIHQGKVISRLDPDSSSHPLYVFPDHGTRVTVRDLFGNFPVRLKQRALSAGSSLDDEKAWQELRYGVVSTLLAWPLPVTIRIRDMQKESRILHLTGYHPSVSSALTCKNLNQIAGVPPKFELIDVLPILFQSSLAPIDSRKDWIPVSATTLDYSVRGLISLRPVPTKQCQFLSIGVHPCPSTSGCSDLYDGINNVFAHSAFGFEDHVIDLEGAAEVRHEDKRRNEQSSCRSGRPQARKGIDRWPMFVIQVRYRKDKRAVVIPDSLSERSMKKVIDILEATATQWLAANHFRPRKLRLKRTEKQTRPSVSSSSQKSITPATVKNCGSSLFEPAATAEDTAFSKKLRLCSVDSQPNSSETRSINTPAPRVNFDSWSRIKSGRDAFYGRLWLGKEPERTQSVDRPTQTRPFAITPLESGELSSFRKDLGARFLETEKAYVSERSGIDEVSPRHGIGETGTFGQGAGKEGPADEIIAWKNPVTGEISRVSARTGVILSSHRRQGINPSVDRVEEIDSGMDVSGTDHSCSSGQRPLTLSRRRPSEDRVPTDKWLPGFLENWDNPVFGGPGEAAIPKASEEAGCPTSMDPTKQRKSNEMEAAQLHDSAGCVPKSLSRAALRRATLIRQVDRKFILCKDSHHQDSDRCLLFLVDQHAASERIILERLLKELCAPYDSDPNIPVNEGLLMPLNKSVKLDRPIHFDVLASESRLFEARAEAFAAWGILYRLSQRQRKPAAALVESVEQGRVLSVYYLPPGISERCLLLPNLLIELLRAEIWTLDDGTHHRRATIPQSDEPQVCPAWLKRIESCPKGLLDMLNSRACRSAVMFNDELSVEECGEILRDLSQCVFPFMCAHGRVSMVPLVELPVCGDPCEKDCLLEEAQVKSW